MCARRGAQQARTLRSQPVGSRVGWCGWPCGQAGVRTPVCAQQRRGGVKARAAEVDRATLIPGTREPERWPSLDYPTCTPCLYDCMYDCISRVIASHLPLRSPLLLKSSSLGAWSRPARPTEQSGPSAAPHPTLLALYPLNHPLTPAHSPTPAHPPTGLCWRLCARCLSGSSACCSTTPCSGLAGWGNPGASTAGSRPSGGCAACTARGGRDRGWGALAGRCNRQAGIACQDLHG